MSSYFVSRPSGNLLTHPPPAPALATKPAPNLLTQKPAPAAAPPPVKIVKVRAHTRAVPTKPVPPAKPVPPVKTAAPAPAAQAKTAARAVTLPSVTPVDRSTVKRFAPNFATEPVAGHVQGLRNPDGSWVPPGGKFKPGAHLALRPFYTNTFTLKRGAGPPGQESTQLNAAQVAAAHKIQVANYGKPGYIVRSLVPGGLDEGGTTSVTKAIKRGADVASMFVPAGTGVKAAGLFGLGLKGLRGLRAGKDVAEGAAAATAAVPAAGDAGLVALRQGYVDQELRAIQVAKDQISGKIPRKFAPGIAEDDLAKAEKRLIGAKKLLAEARAGTAEPPAAAAKATPPAVPPVKGVVEPVSAATIRSAMPGAKILRGKQEAGYSVERAKRFAAARTYLNDQSLSPADRVRLAKRQLAGELPKINFQGFSELNDESVQALATHILDHPHLLEGQKIRAVDALTNALTGRVPTRGEITLLEHVFGKDTAAGLGEIAKSPWRDVISGTLNIPRSLMASFDLSAPFRQGLVVATRHPTIFARNFGSMVKAYGSEKVYQAAMDEIRARPTWPLMEAAKLPLTELGRDIGGREEQFASNYAEKLTGGKYGPVRASGRAYTGFLNKTRADVFDHLIQKAQGQGVNVQDPHFLESLGRYIGSATGRGHLRVLEGAAKELNAVLFSPRLMASRLNFLNPAYYARLHPFARKEALRSAIQLAGTASTLVALASQIPGAKVVTDPRNPDWGKIRLGNTRFDIGGGFQQELRLLAQFATGTAISSTTGKSLSLTTGGYGKPTRLDIVQRFFMGKESPIASLVTDWMRGSTQIGQKFSWKSAAAQRMTPLLAQDAHDIYKEKHGGMNGLMAALAGYGVGSVGIGVQSYPDSAPKRTSSGGSSGYFGTPGGSGGGSSSYFSPSSSSGSGGYFGK